MESDLSWSRDCIISEISRTAAVAANQPSPAKAASETTSATFQIKTLRFMSQLSLAYERRY